MQRTFHLESGESETLKVTPTRKVLSVATFSKGGSVEKVGNVINLYFEGNWMPVKVCIGLPHIDKIQDQSTCFMTTPVPSRGLLPPCAFLAAFSWRFLLVQKDGSWI